jgi:hypothetical protein
MGLEEEVADETSLQAAFDHQIQGPDGEPLEPVTGEAEDP